MTIGCSTFNLLVTGQPNMSYQTLKAQKKTFTRNQHFCIVWPIVMLTFNLTINNAHS